MIFSTNEISSQHFIRQVYISDTIYREAQNSDTIYRDAQHSDTIYREAQNSVKVEQMVYNFDYAFRGRFISRNGMNNLTLGTILMFYH